MDFGFYLLATLCKRFLLFVCPV